jgi:PST family polysaccharide transporter
MVLTNLVNMGVVAILARELSPADFGIVALAQAVLQILMVLGAEGINEFVIQDNKPGKEERVHAAFWMELTFSILATAIGLVALPLVTRFYNNVGLGTILVVLLLRYPIDALSKVPDALIRKHLDFQKLAVRDTALELIGALGSVIMALTGYGVWSLILPRVLVSILRLLVVFPMSRWWPKFELHISKWGEIFSYSGKVIGGTLVSYLVSQGDLLLIGKLLGASQLGIYNVAMGTASLPTQNVTGLANRLALPVLSAVSDDLDRLRRGFHRMMRLVSIATFPLLIGLFAIADYFVLVVYGEQWKEAVLPLRVLIIFALRYSVGACTSALYKSLGRSDITFKLGLAMIPFYTTSIWIGSFYGIVGVAVGATVVRTAFGFVGFRIAANCLNEGLSDVLEPLKHVFLSSCLMGAMVYLTRLLLEMVIPGNILLNLALLVITGGLMYVLLLRIVYRSLAHDITQMTTSFLGQWQFLVTKTLRTS